jgi:hypothetical protein
MPQFGEGKFQTDDYDSTMKPSFIINGQHLNQDNYFFVIYSYLNTNFSFLLEVP